jgi:precorrin-6Y C5,15-methyltransferase (decarboxylating) CbiT subunit
MKNKLKLGQAAGVVAFAIIIGAVSMSSSSTVDARTSLKENRTVNAGVALGLTEAADATELLTAGATSALTYYGDELTVAQNDNNVVTASAQGAPQTDDASQEPEQANEAAQTPTAAQTCGYTNLGMSVISSGTGSIAVEAASLSDDMEVYAIEQKENAVQLITQNKEKHGLENIHVINAKAPDGLDSLPMPTHAFIGGSGGNLKEIIEALKTKNPHIRIVINAISIETICEIKEILSAYDVKNEDIVQLQVSRSKQIGHYHLMQAENPVWICSFEF